MLAPSNRLSDLVQRLRHFGRVELFLPTGELGNRPHRQRRPLYRGSHRRHAAPLPVFRVRDQPDAQGISFHVATQPQEMIVILNSDRLESSLVDGASSPTSSPDPPRFRVASGEPNHERRETVIAGRPEHEVPVIRHQRICEKPHGEAFGCLVDEPEELLVVVHGLEEHRVLHCAVENMEYELSGRSAWTSGHGRPRAREPSSRRWRTATRLPPELEFGSGEDPRRTPATPSGSVQRLLAPASREIAESAHARCPRELE
jgi:hypothetical protein